MTLTPSTTAKKIHLLALLTGFAFTLYFMRSQQLSVAESAWSFWALSFLFSPFVAISGYAIGLHKALQDPTKKSVLTIVGRTFLLVIAITVSVFVHSFIGIFMSVTLPIEPLNIYGPNGYINHFELSYLIDIVGKYPQLIFPFLCLKTSAAVVKSEDLQMGHGIVRHGVLALIFGGIGKLVDHFTSAGALVFGVLTFFPWALIVARDIHSKARVKEADLSPEPILPAHFTDKASAYWGSFFLLFGLVFLSIPFVFIVHIIRIVKDPGVSEFLVGGLFFMAFAGFGLFALFAGVATVFGYTKVSLYPDVVKVESFFRSSFLRVHRWSHPTSEFKLEKSIQRSNDSDGGSYTTYSVEYVHKSEPKKKITLYRSYHPDDLDAKHAAWKQVLSKD